MADMKPAKPYGLRFALPLHYVATLAVALLVLWGLVAVYGRTQWVLVGWAIAFLVASRVVRWVVNRRRKRDPE